MSGFWKGEAIAAGIDQSVAASQRLRTANINSDEILRLCEVIDDLKLNNAANFAESTFAIASKNN